jgi:hypothetical protein
MLLFLQMVVAGCGSGPAPNKGLGFRDRNILTLEEIQVARVGGWTAWDLISQLRPEFLRSRGASSLRSTAPVTAVVYVDDLRFGELDSLRTMSADQINRIVYVNAADATTRYGTDHLGGAILITTK